MKTKLSSVLSKFVYALVALLLLWALIKMFANSFYAYSPLLLGVGTLAALALIVLCWRFFQKHERFLERNSRIITALFLLLTFAARLALSFPLRYEPAYDIGALYGGASEWVIMGSFPNYYEYFAMFHNNFGGLLLFRICFGIAHLFGVNDFFIPACLLNSLLCSVAMYLTASSAGRLFGVRGRMTAFFLFLISLPFYFIAPAFYTDALTMVFPTLIFRLWLLARDTEKPLKKLGVFALMGLAAAIGFGIKATVLIMLIAVIVEGILYDSPKTWLPLAAVAAAIVLLVSFAVNGILRSHVGAEEAERKQVPLTHWVLMGLYGWGGYDAVFYDFTMSFDEPAERSAAINAQIDKRLNSISFAEYLKLCGSKLDLVWNDGTYGLSDCLACPHEQDNYLHEFLVNETAANYEYRHICTSVLAAMYLLIIASCVLDILSAEGSRLLAPRLALLGLMLFFLIWEARWRYFSNYIPMIMLCAITGLERARANILAHKDRAFRKGEAKASDMSAQS